MSQYPPSQYPPSQYPPSQYPPSQYPPSQYPPSQYPPSQGTSYPPPYPQSSSGNGNPYYAPDPSISKPHNSYDALNHSSHSPSPGFTTATNTQASGEKKYQDLWAALLFGVNIIAFCILLGLGSQYLAQNGMNPPSSTTPTTPNRGSPPPPPLPDGATTKAFIILGCTIAFAAGMSFLYLLAMKRLGKFMIKASIALTLVIQTGFALYFLFISPFLGIILLFLAGLTGLYFFWMRSRIPLAAVTLGTVCEVIGLYPALLSVTFLSMISQVLFNGAWSFTVYGAGARFAKDSGPMAFIYIYLVFCLYWVTQVLKNTLHVTVAGCVASFYFLHGTSAMPKNPTLASAKRAFTTSFGSVCFGSLIIALIQTFRYIMRELGRQHEILSAIVDCILACIQGLIEYFNSWAYVQVAVYGKPFTQAAKDTWNLMKSSGVDMIAGDLLVGPVFTVACFTVGLMSAGLGVLGCRIAFLGDQFSQVSNLVILLGIVCFLIGFCTMLIVTMVLDSGVQTTLVCLAENPQALANTKPLIYQKFKEAYPQLSWRY